MKYGNMPPRQSAKEKTSLEGDYSEKELQQAAQAFNGLIDDAIKKYEGSAFGDGIYLTLYVKNADTDGLRVNIESHRHTDGSQIRKLEIAPQGDRGEGIFYSCWGDDVQRLVMDLDDLRRYMDPEGMLSVEDEERLHLKYNQRTPVGANEVTELRGLIESAEPRP